MNVQALLAEKGRLRAEMGKTLQSTELSKSEKETKMRHAIRRMEKVDFDLDEASKLARAKMAARARRLILPPHLIKESVSGTGKNV